MRHPEAIFIQPTTACNAKCVICPHKDTYGRYAKQDMPDEVWEKILEDIIEMDFRGQVGLYLHCEPLRCDTIFDKMCDIRDKTNAYTVLSTNGKLLHEQNRAKLIEAAPRVVHIHPPITDLKFLRDTDESAGAWKRIHAFIEQAKSADLRTIVNIPMLPSYTDTTIESLRQLLPADTEMETSFWAVSRAGSVPAVNAKGHLTRFSAAGTATRDAQKGEALEIITSGGQCVQPKKNLCILHDGHVILCCNDWGRKTMNDFSNVRLMSIQHIYDTQMKAYRIEFDQGEYGYQSICATCAEEMGFERSESCSQEKGS